MNLTRSEKVRLGVFVLVGASIFFGSLLVLAGLKIWEKRDLYWVSFSESVSGLEPSAQVKYRGLRVGRIESMRIDPDNPTAIRAELSLIEGTVLFEGTQAVLEMSGITGLKVVNLTPGDPRGRQLEPGSELPAGLSLVGRIGDRADAISERLERVVLNLERWTGPQNAARLERLLQSSAQLLEDVDRLVVEAKDPAIAAMAEFERSGRAFRRVSEETAISMKALRVELVASLQQVRGVLSEIERIMQAVPTEDVQGTLRSAHQMMSRLNRQLAGDDIARSFAELRGALDNITTLAQDMDLTVRASREDLVLSLKYVRQASQDLREFSRIIAQDPSVLLRGTEVSE
ncbi:MAG: MlaD family protein [Myxococcota bacterium]